MVTAAQKKPSNLVYSDSVACGCRGVRALALSDVGQPCRRANSIDLSRSTQRARILDEVEHTDSGEDVVGVMQLSHVVDRFGLTLGQSGRTLGRHDGLSYRGGNTWQ
jgi:hypothetical protein